jgi:hypothetical protein
VDVGKTTATDQMQVAVAEETITTEISKRDFNKNYINKKDHANVVFFIRHCRMY